MTREEKAARNAIIAERRLANVSMNDIAKEFNLTQGAVHSICKVLGLGGKRSNKKATYRKPTFTKEHFIAEEARRADVVRTRCDGYEYAGNYTGSDGTADIRCVECGEVRTLSWISIRHGGRCVGPCPACEKNKRESEEALKRISRNVLRLRRKAEQKAIREAAHNYVHICPVCGKEFKGTKQRVTCSSECGKKRANRIASRKKDRRFGYKNCIRWQDIRNRTGSMTCALCGGQCDDTDFVIRSDGTVICGDNYPSVDHIVAHANGGTDTWDNVQLAHRICNDRKRDTGFVMFLTDQASFRF